MEQHGAMQTSDPRILGSWYMARSRPNHRLEEQPLDARTRALAPSAEGQAYVRVELQLDVQRLGGGGCIELRRAGLVVVLSEVVV